MWRLSVLLCLALTAPATRPLSANHGKVVGVNSLGAGLPSNSNHHVADATGGQARAVVGLWPKREAVDQPCLVVAPLPVVARVDV